MSRWSANSARSAASFTNTATALTSAPGSNTVGSAKSSNVERADADAGLFLAVGQRCSPTTTTMARSTGCGCKGLAGVTVQAAGLRWATRSPARPPPPTPERQLQLITGLNVGTYSVQFVTPAGDALLAGRQQRQPCAEQHRQPGDRARRRRSTLLPGANTPNQNAGVYVPVSLERQRVRRPATPMASNDSRWMRNASPASPCNLIGCRRPHPMVGRHHDHGCARQLQPLPACQPGTYSVAVVAPVAGDRPSPRSAPARIAGARQRGECRRQDTRR